MEPSGRVNVIGSFEGLRGISALCVVFFHFGVIKTDLFAGAYLFVDVFFVLSGYIMMLNYGSQITGGRTFLRFLGKRFARLYPLFIFTTIILLVAEKVLAPHAQLTHHLLPAYASGLATTAVPHSSLFTKALRLLAWLTMTNSLGIFSDLYWNYPAWSISVEFWTYVVFGAILLFNVARKQFPLICVALIIVAMPMTAYFSIVHHDCLFQGECLNLTYDAGFFRCIVGFFLGVLAFKVSAALRKCQAATWLKHTDSLLIAVLFAVVSASVHLNAIAFAVPFIAASVVTILPLNGYAARLLGSKPLLVLGKLSYAIYLGHIIILLLLKPVSNSPTVPVWGKTALLLILLIPFSALLNRLVEEPMRKYLTGRLESRKVKNMHTGVESRSTPIA